MAQQKTKHWLTLLFACATVALSACDPVSQETGGGGGSDTLSVNVSLASATLISGTSTTVTATVRNQNNATIPDQEVCFTSDSQGSITSATCVETNGSGVATATLEAGVNSGAGVVTATANSVNGTANYTVNGPTLTLSGGLLQISAGTSGTATATVVDGNGDPIPNTVVTFTVGNPQFATLNPTSGAVLTNAQGQASIVLNVGTQSGASTLTATASVSVESSTTNQIIGTASVSDQTNFQSTTSGTTNAISLSPLTLGIGQLSAYGTTSVTVTVLNTDNTPYTTPVTVKFTSNCASQNKATITDEALTINGVATAAFADQGCGNTDTIQATLDGISASASIANLEILAPSIGSIQFVKAEPVNISLKGTGGAGRQETSKVTFKVVDNANNPKAADVTFSLSTTVGGIGLSSFSARSDSTTGEVSTIVQAGTIATPVRVTAAVVVDADTTLTTQSDQLTISTGLPDQAHFSIAADKVNIEGWDVDGMKSMITVRLADHFGNPVPKDTAVSFISEGGAIQSNCTTDADGTCTVTFRSQALRPSDGRVTVLAYAIGEETFTDLNGDGYATTGSERIDANGDATDLGEAFVDYNEDGVRGVTEPFIDFDADLSYDNVDGLLNSTLCKAPTVGVSVCSSRPTLHVRSQNQGGAPFVIVLSDSQAALTGVTAVSDKGVAFPSPLTTGLDLEGCTPVNTDPGRTYDLSFTVASLSNTNNPMPACTQIAVSTSGNGSIVTSNPNWVIGSTLDPDTYTVKVKTDMTTCSSADTTKSGVLTINITTPGDTALNVRGTTTTYTINLRN